MFVVGDPGSPQLASVIILIDMTSLNIVYTDFLLPSLSIYFFHFSEFSSGILLAN